MIPLQGEITSSFGMRLNPILNKEALHTGIDIAAPVGTGVAAVANGVVSEVYSSASYGNVVKYETDDGYTIMLAHLDKALVTPAEKIEKGQIIALSGNTGASTGPHLHFTVWKDGALIDPIRLISLPLREAARGGDE